MNFSKTVGLTCLWLGLTGTVTFAQSVEGSFQTQERGNAVPGVTALPGTSQQLPESAIDPLKPGDRIRIVVAGFPDLSGEHLISTTGMVQLPLAGVISLAGLSPAEAVAPLEQILAPYVRRPQVSVGIVSLSDIRVSVTGEVLHPGPRLLGSLTNSENTSPTLSKAILEAGGITPQADLQNIIIRRQGNTVLGRPVEEHINLWDALQTGSLQADPRIFNGDEIIIPTRVGQALDQRVLLSSTVAAQEVTVQVAGEVKRPGQLQVSPLSSVSGAVAAAGGLTQDATADDIQLFRMTPDGQLAHNRFSFGEASVPLMEGDVIVVGVSSQGDTGNFFDFLGRILNPFGSLLNLLD